VQEYIRKHGGDPDDCDEKEDLIKKATELHDEEKKEVHLARSITTLHSSSVALCFFCIILCESEVRHVMTFMSSNRSVKVCPADLLAGHDHLGPHLPAEGESSEQGLSISSIWERRVPSLPSAYK
jgi:hypothetical protein